MEKKICRQAAREMVTISRAEYEEKDARLASQNERVARLESQIELLTEALRLARYKQFGAFSEKMDEAFMEQLSFLFNEEKAFAEAEAEAEENCAAVVAAHKRHKKHWYTLETHSGRDSHRAGGAPPGGRRLGMPQVR